MKQAKPRNSQGSTHTKRRAARPSLLEFESEFLTAMATAARRQMIVCGGERNKIRAGDF